MTSQFTRIGTWKTMYLKRRSFVLKADLYMFTMSCLSSPLAHQTCLYDIVLRTHSLIGPAWPYQDVNYHCNLSQSSAVMTMTKLPGSSLEKGKRYMCFLE